MEVGKWKMAQAWRHFKRPASSKGLWKQFVEDSKPPVQMAEGGPAQLVQPGPGRQGYGGKFTNRDIAQIKKGLPEGITVYQDTSGAWRYKVEIKTHSKSVSLWDNWWTYGLILGLLFLDWFTRRKFGLS